MSRASYVDDICLFKSVDICNSIHIHTHTYTLSYTLMANLPHMDKDDRDSQRQQREQYTNQIKTDDAN